jgi:hypothetical protein
MSFLAYLARLRIDELPHGHFAQHAHEDPSLPDAQTWEELEAHLIPTAESIDVRCPPPSWPAKAGHPRLAFVQQTKSWMAGLRRP